MNNHWRIIDSGPGPAGWNMALDEALLIMAANGLCPPTLRFFSWETPSLSIGSFQKAELLNLRLIKEKSVPLVRRPTGGRAVLHDRELTYSVTCQIPSPFFPPDLMGSYKKIGSCFLRGLKSVSVEADLLPVSKNPDRKPSQESGRNPLCFSSPSWYEVLVGGKKLIGSAQRRIRGSFLQQGSLLMELDLAGLVSLMEFAEDTARQAACAALASKMTALSELGCPITAKELKGSLVKGFEAEMGVALIPGEPTQEEIALAERLLAEKYSRDEWNLHRETQKA